MQRFVDLAALAATVSIAAGALRGAAS